MNSLNQTFQKQITYACLCCCLTASISFAQSTEEVAEDKDIHTIENLLEKNIKFTPAPTVLKKSTLNTPKKVDYKETQIIGAYQDFAVVQKKYMPKQERFQLSVGATLLPTDVYFRTYGLNSKLTYHFTESWGAELVGYLMTSTSRGEVDDLAQKQQVIVKNLISVKRLYGANLYYSSIYGKTSIFNSKIIPFEIYQTVGLSKVINQNDEEAVAVQAGLGELFSISRSSGIRADLSWAFYQSKTILGDTQNTNSIFVSINYSFFFAEPVYR